MSDGDISRVEFVRLGALAGLAPMVVALASCGSEDSSGGGGGADRKRPAVHHRRRHPGTALRRLPARPQPVAAP